MITYRCEVCRQDLDPNLPAIAHAADHFGSGYRAVLGGFTGREYISTTKSGNTRWRVSFDNGDYVETRTTAPDAAAGYDAQNLRFGDLGIFVSKPSGTLVGILPVTSQFTPQSA